MPDADLSIATVLHFLRSKLFSLLVVVLVLSGYSEVVRGSCGHDDSVVIAGEHCADSEAPHSPSDHSEGDACQCICHSFFLNEQAAARFQPVLLTVLSLLSERADHPPESVPVGIDHPPQLA